MSGRKYRGEEDGVIILKASKIHGKQDKNSVCLSGNDAVSA